MGATTEATSLADAAEPDGSFHVDGPLTMTWTLDGSITY